MQLSRTLCMAAAIAALAVCPDFLKADATGADRGLSGAPGDGTCIQCHGSTLNSGSGSVNISFANGSTYSPGQTQLVTVTIADPSAKRWGFEVSPRLASSPSTTGAGTVATVDAYTQLSGTSGTRQWITHTLAGTRAGTTSGVTFQFNWTAPATDSGAVTFYVAANAANGNNQPDSGDKIYTTTGSLTAASTSTTTATKPAIASAGVVNAASYATSIAAGSWVTITGTNLAPSTTTGRTWTSSEIVNGALPTSLDGVSVTINGKAASVYYVSNTQLNVQAPDDGSLGQVAVVVTNANGSSNSTTVNLQQFAPGLFMFDAQSRKYAAAIISGGAYLGPSGLFGTSLTSRPAAAGDTIELFGTGFGPTSPTVSSGQVYSGSAATGNAVTVTIGGVSAAVSFAGLTGAGLYQINVVVPVTVASGDQAIVASVGGVSTQSGAYISIQ